MRNRKRNARASAVDEWSEQVHDGSGNVFADMGSGDAGERLAKARLAQTVCELIRAAGLTQRKAAERLGIDQPKVSALVRGRLADFSTERLMRFVTALNRDVVITIRDPEETGHASVRVLVEASI